MQLSQIVLHICVSIPKQRGGGGGGGGLKIKANFVVLLETVTYKVQSSRESTKKKHKVGEPPSFNALTNICVYKYMVRASDHNMSVAVICMGRTRWCLW